MTGNFLYIVIFLIFSISIVAFILTVLKPKQKDTSTVGWVAVGQDDLSNKTILNSEDGITWNKDPSTSQYFSSASGHGGSKVAYGNYGNKLWVTVGNISSVTESNKNILYSSNGLDWVPSLGASFSNVGRDVVLGLSGTTDMWVSVGKDINANNNNILWSLNGTTWSSQESGTSFVIGSVGTEGGKAVAYGLSGSTSIFVAGGANVAKEETLLWSINGQEWNKSTTVPVGVNDCRAVFYDYGRWIAGCSSQTGNTALLYSSDGQSWNESSGTSFESKKCHSIAYGDNLWIAVGEASATGAYVLHSVDGSSWFNPDGLDLPRFHGESIKYSNGLWVIGGSSYPNPGSGFNSIYYSKNGISWYPSKGENMTKTEGIEYKD